MTNLDPAERAIMTQVGTGAYLTPSDAAMTRAQLTAWFQLRGLSDGGYRDELLEQYAGFTEAEMDTIYEDMHPQA